MRRAFQIRTLLILCCLLPAALFAEPQRESIPPDKDRVTQALESLKSEEAAGAREMARQSHTFDQIGGWLKDHGFYLRLLAVAGVFLVILLLIYLSARFLGERTFRRRRPRDRRATGEVRRGFDPEFIERLESGGRYNEAVLYLHRLSIERLLETKALLTRNLTNAGILSRLRDDDVISAFHAIAETSERVLFDRLLLTPDRYAPCRAAFDRAFGRA